MIRRLDFPEETDRRLRIHCAMVSGRHPTEIVVRAVNKYLERNATEREREGWGQDSPVSAFEHLLLTQAKTFTDAFRLQDLLEKCGKSDYGMSLARSAGVALREAGFVDRRMRVRGGKPTRLWLPIGSMARTRRDTASK